jgi:hypothetical protein
MGIERRNALLTGALFAGALSGCTLVDLSGLQKGGSGGAGGASHTTTSSTSKSSSSSAQATSASQTASSGQQTTSGSGMTICSPMAGDPSCMKCIRTSCCKELTACDQAPSCADCRDCYLGGSSGCTSACSTTEGMALHDCKSNLCSNACD